MKPEAPLGLELDIPSYGVRWAWFALLVIAIASRLLRLGVPLLAPEEIARALPSLDAARGAGWPVATDSPLLLVGNGFLFTIFAVTDGFARLIPALAGVALVALPLLWRKEIGDLGALVAAGLLIISPLTLFGSRRLAPATPGVLTAGLIVTMLFRRGLDDEAHRRWLSALFAGALGLGLVSGPSFFDLLLPGLFVGYVLNRSGRDRSGWINWRLSLLAAALIGTGISIALGFRWSGWSGIADGFAAWITSWGEQNVGSGATGTLLLYEPLLLLTVLVGIGLLMRRQTEDDIYPWAILLWGIATLLVTALRSGDALSLGAAALPLALFGGVAVQQLMDGLSTEDCKGGGLHALAAFVFWLPGVLAMVQHARGVLYEDQMMLVLVGVIVLLALQALLVFLFAMAVRLDVLWRSALTGFAAVVLILQASFAFGLGFVRADSPIEPAVASATSEDLRHLRSTLSDIGVLRNQRWDALPVAIIEEDAELAMLLRWVLRDFHRLAVVDLWPADPGALVLTPEDVTLDRPPPGEGLRGMSFVASTTYNAPVPACQELVPPACADFLRWYFYRASPYEVWRQSVILWQAEAVSAH
ncbi:MAG: hypothetical protein ACP5JG_02755 [Anaerolineae bacterium]